MINMDDATAPPLDCAVCTLDVTDTYCLDLLAGGTARIIDMCAPCRGVLFAAIDLHMRPLEWAPELLDGIDAPQQLEAITDAGIDPDADPPGPNMVEVES
jgi:hypothetical protein